MPGPDGAVSADSVKEAVRPDTVLVSVMQANNETGVLQPVEEIGEFARANNILFHTDAVCTFGKLPLDMSRLKADFLSVSAHKIGGPKGTGFLYVRRGAALQPTVYGGGQERGLRSGTENTVGIAGLGAAVRRKRDNMEIFGEKTLRLRARLQKRILEEIPDTHVNGSLTNRVPGTLNIRFDGIVGTSLLILLDGKGICASAGAACNNASQKPSHVLTAMGLTEKESASSIRFSLNELNTEEEIDYTVEVLKESVEYLRKMRAL
jgi:cysteine desulfurase